MPAPSSTPPICGDLTTADNNVKGPAVSVRHLTPASPGLDYYVAPSGIYIDNGTSVTRYSLSGRRLASFALPSAFTGEGSRGTSGPLVDAAGDVWLASTGSREIAELSPSGEVRWKTHAFPHPEIYGLHLHGEYRVGVVAAGSRSTKLLSATGVLVGALPVALSGYVSQAPDGDVLVSSGGYVSTYSPAGQLVHRFGSSEVAGSPSYVGQPYHFYYQGSALQPASDGAVYTLDPLSTIEETSAAGILQATTNLGGALQMSQVGQAYIVAGQLFFVTGAPFGSAYQVSSVPLAEVKAYLRLPAARARSLGWGAGITAGQPGRRQAGNYFPDGGAPRFYADLDAWWARSKGRLALTYSVWDDRALRTDVAPRPQTAPLPATAGALRDVALPLPVADNAPGPYEIRAALLDSTGRVTHELGSVCVPYAVGPPGAGLHLASLPAGGGFGGPSDPRGVVLNHQLGLDGFRGAAIDWSVLLPRCNASSLSPATCGPSALDLAAAPSWYFRAAYLARKYRVTYWVQVSNGDPVSRALVDNGWWGPDVARVVDYYHDVAHCRTQNCAPVTAWEAWNEANSTYAEDGAAFTADVLKPFYQAVKSAAPGDVVVGGSSLGVALTWWRQVVAAGGLSYMDAAGVHPYTGYNDSWEEDDVISQLGQLEHLLRGVPVWLTEVGWWSDGPYNFLNQADIVARAMVWQKVLHIPVWSYFYDEGGWGNDGVSFSLVQYETTDNYVKPAALATMEEAAQVGARAYLGTGVTGIPHTYRANFGPSARYRSELSVVWTDGLSTSARIAIHGPGGRVTITDQWGISKSYALRPGNYYALPISDELTYVQFPLTDSLSVQPVQAFGPDLSLHGTPAASSSASGSSPHEAIDAATAAAGWSPAAGDARPFFTVTLQRPQLVNRVIVDMHSLGSVEGNARAFSVSVRQSSGTWRSVAHVGGVFYDHTVEAEFVPTRTTAVRITIDQANFGSSYGGAVPPWWPSGSPVHIQLHSLGIYGPERSGPTSALPVPPTP